MPRREHIYIFFTGTGILFGLVLILIFSAGYFRNGGTGLTQTLGIGLLVAGLVGMIQTNGHLRGLTLAGTTSEPTPAGSEASVLITLRNTSDQEKVGLRVSFARHKTAVTVDAIGPHQSAMVRLPLPARARGLQEIPAVRVSSVFPYGLCIAWRIFPPHASLVVYPTPRGRPLLHEASASGLSPGQERGAEDVIGHGPYHPGDPLTRLDWRIFARTGKLLVRTLEGGGHGDRVLRWRDTAFLPDPEDRLRQLALWLDQCRRSGLPFRLELGTGNHLTHRNVRACLEALATHDTGNSS